MWYFCVLSFFVIYKMYLFVVAHKVFDSLVIFPYFLMRVVAHKVCDGFVF